MNQDVNGNRKLFWKEVRKANGGKVENYNEHYEDLYNTDTKEQVAFHLCGFNGVWRGNYFRGEQIRRMEVEVRVGKLKNGKAKGKDEMGVTGWWTRFGSCVI